MSEPGETTLELDDAFDVLESLPDDSADCAVVDYPWEFDTANGTDRFGHDHTTGEDELYDLEDHEGLERVLGELSRVLTPGSWVFVHADDEVYPEFRDVVETSDLTYRRTWQWYTKSFGMGYYGRVAHYPILTATNGDTDRYVKDRKTVLEAEQVPTNKEVDYRTAKPTKLVRDMLADPVLRDGDVLLEPFCGTAPGYAVVRERNVAGESVGYLGVDKNETALAKARERADSVASAAESTKQQSTLSGL